MRRALLDQGVPVKMIVYNGAGHAGRSFTLNHLVEVMEHNDAWFRRWLGIP